VRQIECRVRQNSLPSQHEGKATVDPAPAAAGGRSSGLASPFRRVLVGWDASPDSVAALRTAAAMVSDGPGHVVALAVLPAPPHLEAQLDQAGEISSGARRATEIFEHTRESIAAPRDVRITLHTAQDRNIARSICAYATEHGFDLLVLGRHGGGGVLHPKLGHVAEATIKASRVPVLVLSAR
jgi:nucleotide-binding universal stress UspA family protein